MDSSCETFLISGLASLYFNESRDAFVTIKNWQILKICLKNEHHTNHVIYMNQKKNTLLTTIGALTASTLVASASGGDWAETLKSAGKLYSNSDNPYIQEVKIFGRAHYQWNYSDGNSDQNFSGNGDELRRLRFGTSVKFLNGFKALGRINLEDGGFRNTALDYDGFDELYLEYGKKDFLGFDSAAIAYGRYKVAVGGEEHISSKKIKTVERSNINNRFGAIRPTGVRLTAEKNGVEYIAGIFSTTADDEALSDWSDGTAFYGSATFDALQGSITADFLHADSGTDADSAFNFDWVTSLSYSATYGDVDLLTQATYGDTGNGNVYGLVILPSTFIVPEKLEAVFRYQWAHATGDSGVPQSSSSRGLRRVASNEGASTGSGDDNHTFYLGLNYYIADNNAKVMIGAEYENTSGGTQDIEGYTLWTGFRAYF